jgi:hypothetical protein
MDYAVEMDSSGMIYVPSFVRIGRGFQEMLRVYLRNLKGSYVGVTNKRK